MPKVLTVDEVSTVLRLGRNTVYGAVKRGEIPSIRVGARILVARCQLASFLGGTGVEPELAL